MSHGSSNIGIKAEPNLTPLLDMVLQLLMFFMITVNFVNNQVNENIKLPEAQSARPMDKRMVDVLYLNLNQNGKLELVGQDPLSKVTDIKVYLRNQIEDTKRLNREKGKGDNVKTTVIIRAHKDANYKDVYQLMQLCKTVGYHRLQLRAIQKAGKA
jgi:biopolymer transport protein ExbD